MSVQAIAETGLAGVIKRCSTPKCKQQPQWLCAHYTGYSPSQKMPRSRKVWLCDGCKGRWLLKHPQQET